MTPKVWTAAEIEQMTPARRHELFEASVVADLGRAPAELLARTRARVDRLVAESEQTQPG